MGKDGVVAPVRMMLEVMDLVYISYVVELAISGDMGWSDNC